MISRVAEHCFWFARYLERAENTARILEVNRTLLLDFHVPHERQWMPIVIISGIPDFPEEKATSEYVQEHLTWEEENPFSVVSSLAWARENARIIREVISAEMWERMNYYHLWMRSADTREMYESDRSEFYAQIRRINQLLHGISDATMAHGEAWEFFRLGKHLERACQTARILDVKYHILLPTVDEIGSPVDHAHWMAILMSCSGYEPFHKKVRLSTLDPGASVAEFLIFDDQFPRSVHHCLTACQTSVEAIGRPTGISLTPADQQLSNLLNWLDSRTIRDVILEGLHESLTHVVDHIHNIGTAIHETYFAGHRPEVAVVSQTQSQH
jgi:uncharacterized alpha-E superfamily protein